MLIGLCNCILCDRVYVVDHSHISHLMKQEEYIYVNAMHTVKIVDLLRFG